MVRGQRWRCGRLYLHFEGINSAAYVWANGQLLGYSQDSCLPAEFEATHVLRPGRNLVTVQARPLCSRLRRDCTCIWKKAGGVCLGWRIADQADSSKPMVCITCPWSRHHLLLLSPYSIRGPPKVIQMVCVA